MKKLLITSSALVAAAGMANADGHSSVSLSMAGEIGISAVDFSSTATDGDAMLHQDIDVNFSGSTETDGGLTIAISADLDEAGNLGANTGQTSGTNDQSTNGTVSVSGGFGNITMGDTDGALDWAMTETAMGTAINDDHTAHAGYNGNSSLDSTSVVRYDNSFGDFSVAASYAKGSQTASAVTAVGFKYTLATAGTSLGIGVGYQDAGTTDLTGISLSMGSGGFTGVLNYSQRSTGAVDTDHMGIGIGYTMDALSLHVNYGEYDNGAASTDGFGATVNYNLGGGVILASGYGSDDTRDTYSLGLRIDF